MARLSIVLLVVAQLGEVSINAVRVVSKKSGKVEECCCKPMEEETMCTEGKWQACVAFQKDKPQCCQTTSSCDEPQKTDKKLCGDDLHLGAKEEVEVETEHPAEGEVDPLSFLTSIKEKTNDQPDRLTRDYTIIVDRSGSMGWASNEEEVEVPEEIVAKMKKYDKKYQAHQANMGLWAQAEAALVFLADAAVAEDPDGISLIFFDHEVVEEQDVKTTERVMQLFKTFQPRGTTHLDKALEKAVKPDTVGRAETILVITDGAPGPAPEIRRNVENVIVQAAKQLCRDEDLSISFIQIGSNSCDDKQNGIPTCADEYLKYLDDDLQGTHDIYDIVDATPKSVMEGKNFMEIIVSSLDD